MNVELKELEGNNMPKVDVKLEQNSKGVNVTIHAYQGVTEKEIKEVVDQAVIGLDTQIKK